MVPGPNAPFIILTCCDFCYVGKHCRLVAYLDTTRTPCLTRKDEEWRMSSPISQNEQSRISSTCYNLPRFISYRSRLNIENYRLTVHYQSFCTTVRYKFHLQPLTPSRAKHAFSSLWECQAWFYWTQIKYHTIMGNLRSRWRRSHFSSSQ